MMRHHIPTSSSCGVRREGGSLIAMSILVEALG